MESRICGMLFTPQVLQVEQQEDKTGTSHPIFPLCTGQASSTELQFSPAPGSRLHKLLSNHSASPVVERAKPMAWLLHSGFPKAAILPWPCLPVAHQVMCCRSGEGWGGLPWNAPSILQHSWRGFAEVHCPGETQPRGSSASLQRQPWLCSGNAETLLISKDSVLTCWVVPRGKCSALILTPCLPNRDRKNIVLKSASESKKKNNLKEKSFPWRRKVNSCPHWATRQHKRE